MGAHPPFFGDVEKSAKPFLHTWKQQKEDKGIIFFIGSETGFSEREIKTLLKLNATGVIFKQAHLAPIQQLLPSLP